MPPTRQSGKQQSSTAGTGFGSSSSSLKSSSKFTSLIQSLKGKSITKTKLRDTVFNRLLDDAVETPEEGKYYFFDYDPKFKSVLKEWDQFPLIKVLEVKGNIYLGANLHYIKSNARLSAINNKKYPAATLHYYIPKNADDIFFEVSEEDIQVLSQLPLEKFHRNK